MGALRSGSAIIFLLDNAKWGFEYEEGCFSTLADYGFRRKVCCSPNDSAQIIFSCQKKSAHVPIFTPGPAARLSMNNWAMAISAGPATTPVWQRRSLAVVHFGNRPEQELEQMAKFTQANQPSDKFPRAVFGISTGTTPYTTQGDSMQAGMAKSDGVKRPVSISRHSQ